MSQWDEVRRIYRRVCVLRAGGKIDEAAQLENIELASALAVARLTPHSPDEESALLAEEAERVANASVLAELLAPMLAEHLRVNPPPVQATPPAPEPKPRNTAARPPPAKAPSIADLLDGMLSQEPSSGSKSPPP
jgi:hypothetical protein